MRPVFDKKALLLASLVLAGCVFVIPFPTTVGGACIISIVGESGNVLPEIRIFRSLPMYIGDSAPSGEELTSSTNGTAVFVKRMRWLSLANRLASAVVGLAQVHSGLGADVGYTVRLPPGTVAEVKGTIIWKEMSVPDRSISFVPDSKATDGRCEIKVVMKKTTNAKTVGK